MPYYLNPKRSKRIKHRLLHFFIKPLISLGFKNVEYYYLHGLESGNHLTLSPGVSTADAVFNIASGNIYVGPNTIFGHGCYVLTGFHQFFNGRLAKLDTTGLAPSEVPASGHDISIGSGCYIGTGAIILRGCTLGDNTIVGAGSIVTKSFHGGGLLVGAPARAVEVGVKRGEADVVSRTN